MKEDSILLAFRKSARYIFTAPTIHRATALTMTERLSALTHLASSLEYLTRKGDRKPGGINNWAVTRQGFDDRPAWLLKVLDVVAEHPVTTVIHVVRVGAAGTLLLAPDSRRPRMTANIILAFTSAALYPRHHYGADGSDQAAFVVQAAAAIARADERHPQTIDACLWFIALQSVLSYTASGWVKMTSPTWRSGRALPGILRTQSFGDRQVWEILRQHPNAARIMGAGVLAMECLFPAVFAARGRLAPTMIAMAATFHIVNGRVIGLGRFVWAFISMHPAVLYAAGRSAGQIGEDGQPIPSRDDLMPKAAVGLMAAFLATGFIAQIRRRRSVLRGRGDEELLRSSTGNTLAFRRTGPSNAPGPVVILENGLMETPEHFEWITRELSKRWVTVTYQRAGSGASTYGALEDYSLDVSVQDLTELIKHTSNGCPVILVGHSLGGYLVFLAASRLPSSVAGACLIDSSHPAELQRSTRQAKGAELLSGGSLRVVSVSLQLGLGNLLKRAESIDKLPAAVQNLALAQYRDARLWSTGCREWEATADHFMSFDGNLPDIDAPCWS